MEGTVSAAGGAGPTALGDSDSLPASLDANPVQQAQGMPGSSAEGSMQSQQQRGSSSSADHNSAILKLKGLPYSATEVDIKAFFGPGFDVRRIAWVSEPDGRASGLAFAEFGSKEEALKALAKNGEYIGDRYVRLLHVPRSEMEEQVRLGTLAIPGAAAKLRSRMMRAQQRNSMAYVSAGPIQVVPTTLIQQQGGCAPGQLQATAHQGSAGPGSVAGGIGPSAAGSYVVQAPLGVASGAGAQFSLQPMAQGGQASGAPGAGPGAQFALPSGQYTVQAVAQGGAQYAMQAVQGNTPAYTVQGGAPYTMHSTGPYSVQITSSQVPVEARIWQPSGFQPAPAYHQPQQISYQHSPMTLATQFHGLSVSSGNTGQSLATAPGALQRTAIIQQAPQQLHPAQVTQIGLPGVQRAGNSPTVKIRGLPYRSSPADILAFFQGYHYIPDSLQIGLDQLGRPSGEAWLTFISPQEAMRSVRDLNRHYLGSRYLELSIC